MADEKASEMEPQASNYTIDSTINAPNNKMRVKVYQLGAGNAWIDQGTGHCSCVFNEEKSEGTLVVQSEDGENKELLRSRIRVGDDVYQRQQATLIVWSDEDEIDLALSFQEAEGCTEIWDDISELQQHYAEDLFSDPADINGNGGADYITLPDPNITNLKEIEDLIKTAQDDNIEKEKLSAFIIIDNYIDKLFPVLEICEDQDLISELHLLHCIMLGIIHLNDIAILQYILKDGIFVNCIGMLEYEPGMGDRKKANYREVLANGSKFKQILPIKDLEVKEKIHQVFRLQFLREMVLSPSLDENLSSVLGSLIFFHNIDIVNSIHQDRPFLKTLFGILERNNTEETVERRRDVVQFVQQFCSIARTTQMTTRVGLYRTLCQSGLFNVFEMALADSERPIKMAGAEIMLSALEHDASLVRSHIVKQAQDTNQGQLFDVLIGQFLVEKDAGVMIQISELIRVLLDTSPNFGENGVMPSTLECSANLYPDADKFLELFYSLYVERFTSPLFNLTEDCTVFDRPMTTLCENICNILAFMVRQHQHRSKYYVLSSGIITNITFLLKNRDQHLRLTALKFFRTCIGMSEEFYHRYLIKHDVVKHILDLLFEVGHKNNLLSSVCLEFFEFIRIENRKTLLDHIAIEHRARLKEITYIDTFDKLISQYEQQRREEAAVAEAIAQEAELSKELDLGYVESEEAARGGSVGNSDHVEGSDSEGDDGVPDREDLLALDQPDEHAPEGSQDKPDNHSRPPRRKLSDLEDDCNKDGGDKGAESAKEIAIAEQVQSPPEKKTKLEQESPSSKSPSPRGGCSPDTPNAITSAIGSNSSSSSEAASEPKDDKSPSSSKASSSSPLSLPFISTSKSPSPSRSPSPSSSATPSPPLSPLPVIATRTGIIFVKAGTDCKKDKDKGQQSSEAHDVSKTPAAIRLKSDLATGSGSGSARQNEAAAPSSTNHLAKRRRDEDDISPAEFTSGRVETRRRIGSYDTATLSPSSPASEFIIQAASPRQDNSSVAVANELGIVHSVGKEDGEDGDDSDDDEGATAGDRICLSQGSATPLRVSAE